MAQYVILQHDFPTRGRDVHWDLMLEVGQVLRTWALAEPPAAGAVIAAEQLPDHRLAYLDHEGPVSGGKGTVSRWDAGTFETTVELPNRLIVGLMGDRLNGQVTLERHSDETSIWNLSFEPTQRLGGMALND